MDSDYDFLNSHCTAPRTACKCIIPHFPLTQESYQSKWCVVDCGNVTWLFEVILSEFMLQYLATPRLTPHVQTAKLPHPRTEPKNDVDNQVFMIINRWNCYSRTAFVNPVNSKSKRISISNKTAHEMPHSTIFRTRIRIKLFWRTGKESRTFIKILLFENFMEKTGYYFRHTIKCFHLASLCRKCSHWLTFQSSTPTILKQRDFDLKKLLLLPSKALQIRDIINTSKFPNVLLVSIAFYTKYSPRHTSEGILNVVLCKGR